MAERSVTAIVVNYRSGDRLGSCLASLLADQTHLARLIVVDNDSGDSSWEAASRASEADPRVTLLHAPANLGLAGGVNLALEQVETPLLAILNPDVVVAQGWLTPLVTSMDGDEGIGVSCPLVLIEGTNEINSAGQQVHVTGLGFNRGLHRRAGWAGIAPHDVGGLHGAAFVIRTELLRELGGWDETGFLYHEDVALSWDVLTAGRRIVCVPESRVEHDYHLTMYPEKLHLLERNRWALLLSHLRLGRLALITPSLLLTESMVWALCLKRGAGFPSAKWGSYRWLVANRRRVTDWRRRVFARPRYREDLLRKATRWSYPLSQLGILGAERGPSRRVPPGGLPI